MKKTIIFCAVVIVIIIGGLGFLFRNEIAGFFGFDEKIGSYGGNIVNGGLVAENDDYIFISSTSGKDTGIFRKAKSDGELVKISDDTSGFINLKGSYVYYVNWSENGKIYKMDFDGDDKEKVNDFEQCEYLGFGEEGAFFEYAEQGNIYSPYRFENNFKDVVKINSDDTEGLVYCDGYLYYSNWSDGGKIYKMKADGSEKTVLNDCYSNYINVSGEWIYYSNSDDGNKIYKMKTDGAENSVVCEDDCNYLNYFEDYIYYSNASDDNKVYKIKTDGNDKVKISDDNGVCIFIADRKVFYINSNDLNLYFSEFDGSGKKTVFE